MLGIWLKRLLFSSKNILKLKTFLSFAGLALGVSCLVVTMTVMSSYETTLKKTLIDYTGHILLAQKDRGVQEQTLLKKLQPYRDQFESYTPYVSVEALAVADGALSGIFLEGMDQEHHISHLKERLIEGDFFNQPDQAVVGRELAHHLNLQTGSSFSIVVSHSDSFKKNIWQTRLKNFTVSGIVDLGRHDFNSRYVVVSLPELQQLLGMEHLISGLKIRLKEDKIQQNLIKNLKEKLGSRFIVQDWRSINENLFTAIEMEKFIIFFVLLVLIVAAGFNISNQLFIDVLRRFRDIGILRAMGAGSAIIVQLFFIQCLIISVIGTLIGFIFGLLISYGLFVFYDVWGALAPSDIYKINKIVLDFRLMDFVMIFIFSISISLLGSLIPIKKALSLSPKEGLGYE